MDFENNNIEKKIDLFGSFKGSTATSTGSGKQIEKPAAQVGGPKPASVGFQKPVQPIAQKSTGGLQKPVQSSTPSAPKPATQVFSSMSAKPTVKSGSENNKRVFICIKCGYKFSIDVSKYKKIDCPWCATEQPIQKNY